ncbi:MAG: Kelch repeat-containing protein [Candidatus Bathyarchaeia archaeon]
MSTLNFAYAAENEWVSKADMPTARGYLHVATVEGKIYAIGGSGPIGTNEEYDPQNDTWATKTPMPNPEQTFAIAVCQNKIYCIGGEDKTQVYDPATDTWEIKADMPTARYGAVAQVVEGKIYVIGGAKNLGYNKGNEALNVTEVYDPTTDTWSTKAAVPYAVPSVSAVIDNKIYLIGSQITQIYDPTTDIWTTTASPQETINMGGYGLAAAAAATTGEMAPKRIYVYDGTTLQIYDPYTDTWTNGTAPPTSRQYIGIAVVNDLLYFIGGFKYEPPGFYYDYATNEQYTPIGYGIQPTPTDSPSTSEFSLMVPIALLVVSVVVAVGVVAVYLKRRKR